MARTRNPRTVILDDLRLIKRWLGWYIGMFNPGKLIWDAELDATRPRVPADNIENRPDKLREFATRADEAAAALKQIADFAREAANAAEARKDS